MLKRVRGLKALVHDAVNLTVDLVEDGHQSVARNAVRVLDLLALGPGPAQRVEQFGRLAVPLALGPIRMVNRVVARITDAGMDGAVAAKLVSGPEVPATAVPMRSDITGSGAWLSDAAVGALNGAVGDYLHREGNGLDLGFQLRQG